MKKIILASTSPRRKEILEKLGIQFTVVPINYEEDMTLDMSPENLVMYLATGKARSVEHKFTNSIIISADTFIVFENKKLGKPFTNEKAKEMLQMLSDKNHQIITGVAILDTETGAINTFCDITKVKMLKLSDKTIENYVNTGEPLDRAGAYALQEKGALLIEKIEGDFYGAMGLPLRKVAEALTKLGIEIWG